VLLWVPLLGAVSFGVIVADTTLPAFAQYGLVAPLLALIIAAWYRAEKRADRLEAEVLRMAQANVDKVVPALEAAGLAVKSSGEFAAEMVTETKALREHGRETDRVLERAIARLDARGD
jgi:DNA-binding MarR family transcriptional regulator